MNTRLNSTKSVFAILLSVALGFFLADAGVSLLDDTLIWWFGIQALGAIRGILAFLAVITSILIYLLSGITPLVPKRLVLPMALFYPAAMLAGIPFLIYHYERHRQIAWIVSFCQVAFGLGILYLAQGTFRIRWPWVREDQMGNRIFGWMNLSGFVLVNVFVLPAGVLLYLAFCVSLAVDHFSESFLVLRPDGLTVRARTYVRGDGKTIQLIPMMHIGDAGFYRQISKSFPANAVILLEGVTDRQNLIKSKLSYKRMAKALGLTEQNEEFATLQGKSRRADVDVAQFSKESIEILNLASRIHSEGLTLELLAAVIQMPQDAFLEEQLREDILVRRNAHLLKEIQAEIPRSSMIVVPWGAAHMPGIAWEIQKSGFHLSASQEYNVVSFPSVWDHGSKKK